LQVPEHEETAEDEAELDAKPAEHMESHSHPDALDDSPPTSTTSSWDRMSSDSLEDKPESTAPTEGDHLPEIDEAEEEPSATEVEDSETKPESQLPESKEQKVESAGSKTESKLESVVDLHENSHSASVKEPEEEKKVESAET